MDDRRTTYYTIRISRHERALLAQLAGEKRGQPVQLIRRLLAEEARRRGLVVSAPAAGEATPPKAA